MPRDRADKPHFGEGPLSSYERPSSLRSLDIVLGVLLLGLLGYTAFKGYWEVFVVVLAVAGVSARRDMLLGFRVTPDDD
jgi:hypothetical protein